MLIAAIVGLLASACQEREGGPAAAGLRVYRAYCIACHNIDPRRAGTLGPAIAGSSRDLIEARILRAEYPPGYGAKQDTNLMPAQPFLGARIDALAAYLSGPEDSPGEDLQQEGRGHEQDQRHDEAGRDRSRHAPERSLSRIADEGVRLHEREHHQHDDPVGPEVR